MLCVTSGKYDVYRFDTSSKPKGEELDMAWRYEADSTVYLSQRIVSNLVMFGEQAGIFHIHTMDTRCDENL